MDFNKFVKNTGQILKATNNGDSFTILYKNHGCLKRNRSYGIETVNFEGQDIPSLCFYNISRLRDAETIYKWALVELKTKG